MSAKTVKNSISGILQHVFTAGLTFVSIPIFIRELGAEQYGLYSILTILGNLNVLANLGLNTTLVKSLSLQGKTQQSEHDIVVTILFVLAISLPLTALAYVFEHSILTNLLNIGEAGYNSAKLLYRCILIANILLLVGQSLVAILESQAKFHLTNGFQFVYNSIYWIGTILVVKLGLKLNGVGIIAVVSASLWLALLIWSSIRHWGPLNLAGLNENFRFTLRKQLSHGIKIFSGGLLGILIEPVTKILTGNLIGIKEVGYLEIAYKLRTQFWGLIMKGLAPILPLIAQNKSAQLSRDLIVGTQKNLLVLITALAFIVANTLPFLLTAWLGEVNNDLTITVLFLTLSYILSSIAIPSYFAQLTFSPSSIIFAHVCNLSLNILITYILYPIVGYKAVIIGSSTAFLLANILNIYIINVRALAATPSPTDIVKFSGVVATLFIASQLFVRVLPISNIIICMCYGIYISTLSILLFPILGINIMNLRKITQYNRKQML
jgi:O-antigen/teichoic acid export membrane protein